MPNPRTFRCQPVIPSAPFFFPSMQSHPLKTPQASYAASLPYRVGPPVASTHASEGLPLPYLTTSSVIPVALVHIKGGTWVMRGGADGGLP